MRLTYKLEKSINTKYLHYDYMPIADYDISRGNYGRITDSEIYNKLGQLEDIEQELGIDLLTLSKALKNGIYIKTTKRFPGTIYDVRDIYLPVDYETKAFYIECTGYGVNVNEMFFFKDYGKTWALTREELE